MADIPHFALPFRFSTEPRAVEIEQDSIEEIAACVEAIIRIPKGFRLEDPELGIDGLAFVAVPNPDEGSIEHLMREIEGQEPRANPEGYEEFDIHGLVRDIVVVVRGEQDG